MTTTRVIADYLPPQSTNYRNYTNRDVPRDNYAYNNPHEQGVITKKTRSGSYNVIEKDFGDHKRIYHVPIEYGDNYDLSQLDEPTVVEETRKPSPRLVRRRIYHQYDDYPEPVDYEYVEVPPAVPPPVTTRTVYVSPRRASRDTEVVEEIIETVPANRKVHYIYEDDNANAYEYRPVDDEVVEYVIREPAPKTIYMDEPTRPARRMVYVDDEPRPPPTAEMTPRSNPTPVRHSPPHVVPPPPPPPLHTQRSPQPSVPLKTSRFNDISPPPSHRKPQPISHSDSNHVNTNNNNNSNRNDPPPLRLMDVIAQNRARRGARPQKPRREVDEAKVYDPPTYNRNIIKNGFIVHK